MTGLRAARLLATAFVLSAIVAAAAPGPVPPDAPWLLREVEALTAPEMAGRGSGTPGGDRAARHLAGVVARAGLRPGGDAGTFFQWFVVASAPRLAPDNRLASLVPAGRDLVAGRDFTPHGGSPSADVTADLLLAGHGVVAPDQDIDDYAGLDPRGRIVLVRSGAPSGYRGPVPSRLDKLVLARARGAAALLVADDPLPSLEATLTRVDLPSASITPGAAAALAGLAAPRLRLRTALAADERRAANVVAVLPGTDPGLAGEAIVIGAHYDHLGEAGGAVYPGADDNASGTAVVLGLARAFAAAGGHPRSLVFALFAGEEIGLVGSRHFVAGAGARAVAMLNFDMVGRLGDGRLHVAGVDSGSGLRQAVVEAARGEAVDLALWGEPFAPSDHLRFYAAGTPVLFFHTGRHGDHHRPTDTADRIDAAGMARVGSIAARLIERLARAPRPQYVRLDPAEQGGAGRDRRGEAFFGVVADGRRRGDGVTIAGVVPDSAAARLGLIEGDVIVRFGGISVNAFSDLLDAVRARRPGEPVHVVYLREGTARAGVERLGARP